jgi:hypothetical protein
MIVKLNAFEPSEAIIESFSTLPKPPINQQALLRTIFDADLHGDVDLGGPSQ